MIFSVIPGIDRENFLEKNTATVDVQGDFM